LRDVCCCCCRPPGRPGYGRSPPRRRSPSPARRPARSPPRRRSRSRTPPRVSDASTYCCLLYRYLNYNPEDVQDRRMQQLVCMLCGALLPAAAAHRWICVLDFATSKRADSVVACCCAHSQSCCQLCQTDRVCAVMCCMCRVLEGAQPPQLCAQGAAGVAAAAAAVAAAAAAVGQGAGARVPAAVPAAAAVAAAVAAAGAAHHHVGAAGDAAHAVSGAGALSRSGCVFWVGAATIA
jgi:hypothetical protein